MVFDQGGLLLVWPFIRLVFILGWSLIRVVFYSDVLFSVWSSIRLVLGKDGLSSSWSFFQGGVSLGWSHIIAIFDQEDDL